MYTQPKTTTTTTNSRHQPINTIRSSTTTMTTAQQQQLRQQQQQQQQFTTVKKTRQRKRCGKNQKIRRFKKKCIKRGLNKDEIEKLINDYNQNPTNPRANNENQQMDIATTTNNKSVKRKSNKRKRIVTSVSERSIHQRIPKRNKKDPVMTMDSRNSTNTDYKLPKYLKKASHFLFRNLRLQLKKKLNTKKQQHFVRQRLQLFDQQYRLDLHRHLWESYLTLGSEHQIWSVSLFVFLFFKNKSIYSFNQSRIKSID